MTAKRQTGWIDLFKQDAARWVEPERVGDPAQLTPRLIAVLLIRHRALRAMGWMRFGGFLNEVGVRGGPSWVQRRIMRRYGLEINPGRHIAGGCYIAHPVGCVLRASSIGENATIIGSVTLGSANDLERSPTLGNRVFLGVGCRVLGGITLGDDSRVGANAVVLRDVPAGVTVVGVPASPVRKSAAR